MVKILLSTNHVKQTAMAQQLQSSHGCPIVRKRGTVPPYKTDPTKEINHDQ
ncbi:MAG: hypothetical protein R8J84_01850 [Mariprofundales bacterium]